MTLYTQAFLSLWILPLLLQHHTIAGESTSYNLFMQPGADIPIRKFESKFTIPQISNTTGIHAIWPGLENQALNFVYQNVVHDANGNGIGEREWVVWMESCCSPNENFQAYNVYPGDTIHSVFEYDIATLGINNTFIIGVGEIGKENGQTGRTVFQNNTFPPTVGKLNRAVISIELQDDAVWDFGKVEWNGVSVTAQTTDGRWCVEGFSYSSAGGGSFNLTHTNAMVQVVGDSTICSYEVITFQGPE